MTRSYYSCSKILGVALLAGLWTIACSSDEGGGGGTTGGATGTGGKASTSTTAKTGGATSTGTKVNTGGASTTGGVPATGTGGASSTGTGTKPTGGATSTSTVGQGGVTGGGTTSGGGTRTGGTSAVGGTISTTTTAPVCDASADGGPPCGGGFMKLYVPLATADTQTEFEEDYGTSTTIDLTNGVVTAHVYVDTEATAGGLRLYAKNDDVTNYATVYSDWANLSDLNGKWTDIQLNAAALPKGPTVPVEGTFDKSIVRWVGLNVAAGAAWDGGVFDTVTVYVDWIKFTPASPYITDDMNFTTGLEGFAINTNNSPVTGSTVTWYGG